MRRFMKSVTKAWMVWLFSSYLRLQPAKFRIIWTAIRSHLPVVQQDKIRKNLENVVRSPESHDGSRVGAVQFLNPVFRDPVDRHGSYTNFTWKMSFSSTLQNSAKVAHPNTWSRWLSHGFVSPKGRERASLRAGKMSNFCEENQNS